MRARGADVERRRIIPSRQISNWTNWTIPASQIRNLEIANWTGLEYGSSVQFQTSNFEFEMQELSNSSNLKFVRMLFGHDASVQFQTSNFEFEMQELSNSSNLKFVR